MIAPIALGIIGCGRATRTLHLPALRFVPEFRVVALADTDRARLEAVAERFHVPRKFGEIASLLDKGGVDAVAVCSPAVSHAEVALMALAAGKHVFVEKPLAATIADGELLAQTAGEGRHVTALGFNLRCHRLVRRARDMIGSGQLGNIHQVATIFASPMQHDPAMPQWRRGRLTAGGALFEIGVHHIDLCAFLLDDAIREVQLLSRSGECEDESVSLLARTSGGVLISSSFSQVTAPVNEIQVFGDQARLSFSAFRADSFEVARLTDSPYGAIGRLRRLGRLRELPTLLHIFRRGGDFFLSYQEQWKRFAAAIRSGSSPASSFADGLDALRVVHAALASAASGTRVFIADGK